MVLPAGDVWSSIKATMNDGGVQGDFRFGQSGTVLPLCALEVGQPQRAMAGDLVPVPEPAQGARLSGTPPQVAQLAVAGL